MGYLIYRIWARILGDREGRMPPWIRRHRRPTIFFLGGK